MFSAFSAATGLEGAISAYPHRPKMEYVRPGSAYRTQGSDQPWRQDARWPDLVRLSWTAMKPFAGNVTLKWSDDHWEIKYGGERDLQLLDTAIWRLNAAGSLERVP